MEKQIEEMARIYEFACDETKECTRKCGICHATLLFNAGYRKQEWISVEDRLPERYQTVLVHTIDGEIETDFLTIFGDFVIYEKKRITHWQPLPQPPKMKGE